MYRKKYKYRIIYYKLFCLILYKYRVKLIYVYICIYIYIYKVFRVCVRVRMCVLYINIYITTSLRSFGIDINNLTKKLAARIRGSIS
jgi:hypothetical protein